MLRYLQFFGLSAICNNPYLKWGFHRPTKPADERQKSAGLWDFEQIFGRCYRFDKSAD